MKRLFDEDTEHFVITSEMRLSSVNQIFTKEAAESLAKDLIGRPLVMEDGGFIGAVTEATLDYDNDVIHIVGDIKKTVND